MSLSVEEARRVSEMRLAIVENIKANRPPSEGIDKDELKKMLDAVRADRTIGAAGSGKARKKAAEPVVPMDLKAWLKS